MRGIAVFLLGAALPAAGQWVVAEEPDLTSDAGWWEEPVEAAACGAGWAAVWDVYDWEGVRRPWVWGSELGWEEVLGGQEGAAAGVVSHGDGVVVAATALTSSDSLGVQATGVVRGWGGSNFPQVPLAFLSGYNELNGLATTDNRIAAVGMSLDPCCVHQEVPVVALLDGEGNFVEAFGGGKIAVDVVGPVVIDTLGLKPDAGGNRHDQGGVLHAAAFDGEALVVGGAYSNALYYEAMVMRFLPDGTLDAGFGEGGLVHWDLDPGNNTWVESLAVLPDGRVLCLIRAHEAGDWEPVFHVLTLDATGAPVGVESSAGTATWGPHGVAWGAEAWTAWGASEAGALVGRWETDGPVLGQILPGAEGWQAARGAWNGEAMAVFGRAEDAWGEPVARMRVWHPDAANALPATRTPHPDCASIHPNPAPAGTLPSLPFVPSAWHTLHGLSLSAPTRPGLHFVRTPNGTTCPVIFE